MPVDRASAAASGVRSFFTDGVGKDLLANKWLLAGLAGGAAGYLFGGRSTKATLWGVVVGLVGKLVSPSVYAAYTAARAGAPGPAPRERKRSVVVDDAIIDPERRSSAHQELGQQLANAVPGKRMAERVDEIVVLRGLLKRPERTPLETLAFAAATLRCHADDLKKDAGELEPGLKASFDFFLNNVDAAIASAKSALAKGGRDADRSFAFAFNNGELTKEQFARVINDPLVVQHVSSESRARLRPLAAAIHAVQRYMLIERHEAEKEGLPEHLEALLTEITNSGIKPGAGGVFFERVLARHLESDSPKHDEALHLLRLPFVKEYLTKTEDWSFTRLTAPDTINDVIRANPETRRLGAADDKGDPYAQLRLDIAESERSPYFERLCRLDLWTRVQIPPRGAPSFPDALLAARRHACNVNTLKEIHTPMNDEPSLTSSDEVWRLMNPPPPQPLDPKVYSLHTYRRFSANPTNDPGIAQGRFHKAGLGHLYDPYFRKPADFWGSELTFAQILDRQETPPDTVA